MLKGASKLLVDQEAGRVEMARAGLSFPVDIAFLSFTFGSAILYNREALSSEHTPAKEVATFMSVAFLSALIVIWFCRRSDKSYNDERRVISCIVFCCLSYLVSFFIAGASLFAGSWFG